MRKLEHRLLAALGCTVFVASVAELRAQPTEAELTQKVDEVFAEWDSTSSPGCSLAVIRDGDVIYGRGYGMANLEYDVAISPRSVFRIGSTSKQFTAAAVALLAGEGKLSLDDDIREHLPEMPRYDSPVTIRHLIHHTSGVRDYLTLMWLKGKRDEDYYTDEEVVVAVARQKELNFEPGERYLYSNSGYFLLSQIVESASGQTLAEYARQHIFDPLGMTNTHFHDDHRRIVKNRADGYGPTEDGGWEINKTTLEMLGDGAVFTTVEDLLLWDRNFYDNKLGQGGPALIEQLLTPGMLNDGERQDYAFGLTVRDYKGLRMISHGGGFVGYRAEMIRFPDESFSVACLCNLSGVNPSRLARQVADVYLAGKFQQEEAVESAEAEGEEEALELTPEQLSRWAGRYFDPDDQLLRRIEVRDGKLVYARGSGNDSVLEPVDENRFRMLDVGADVEVSFESPEPDAAITMTVVVNGGEPGVLERVEPVGYGPDDLAQFAGRYYSEELDTSYRISVKGEGLAVKIGQHEEIELTAAVPDLFIGDLGFEFSRDGSGRADGFSLSAGRVRNLKFIRRP